MADSIQALSKPEQVFASCLKAARAGRLETAARKLRGLIGGPGYVGGLTIAKAYELLGRCELGQLCNIQAMISFQEAGQAFRICGRADAEAYCRLMQVRKLIDDRLLNEARAQVDRAMFEARDNHWLDVYRLGLEFSGLICLHTKEHERAAGLLEAALANPDCRKLPWEHQLVKLGLTNCFIPLGQNDRAVRLLTEIAADPCFDRIPRLSIYTLMNLGYQAYLRGDRGMARRHFADVAERVSHAECRQPQALGWLGVMARYNTGQLAIDDGDYAAAVGILEEVVDYTSNHGHSQLLAGSLLALCIAELLLDRPHRAMLHAQHCQQHVDAFGDIETRLAGYILALVHLADNQLESARRLWSGKSSLADNSETDQHYAWMRQTLVHLRDNGGRDPFNLDGDELSLAGDWLTELQGPAGQAAAAGCA